MRAEDNPLNHKWSKKWKRFISIAIAQMTADTKEGTLLVVTKIIREVSELTIGLYEGTNEVSFFILLKTLLKQSPIDTSRFRAAFFFVLFLALVR